MFPLLPSFQSVDDYLAKHRLFSGLTRQSSTLTHQLAYDSTTSHQHGISAKCSIQQLMVQLRTQRTRHVFEASKLSPTSRLLWEEQISFNTKDDPRAQVPNMRCSCMPPNGQRETATAPSQSMHNRLKQTWQEKWWNETGARGRPGD